MGVGVYTNPLTQYVHLDVRERSYHWIDASPPVAPGESAPWGYLVPRAMRATSDAKIGRKAPPRAPGRFLETSPQGDQLAQSARPSLKVRKSPTSPVD